MPALRAYILGMSLFKLIFTLGAIYVVWFAFKYRARIAAAHKSVMEEKAASAARANAAARAAAASAATRPPGTPIAQDLLPCPKCGAYIAAGAACSCQKA